MDIHGYPHKIVLDMDMDMDMDVIIHLHGKPDLYKQENFLSNILKSNTWLVKPLLTFRAHYHISKCEFWQSAQTPQLNNILMLEVCLNLFS